MQEQSEKYLNFDISDEELEGLKEEKKLIDRKIDNVEEAKKCGSISFQ